MKMPEHYETDCLLFFAGKPEELELYEAFFQHMCDGFPDAEVRVQKSQISFYGRHLFAAASLPRRKQKGVHALLVTFGLSHRLESSRIAVAVEPYPNRWTHHVLVTGEEQIDKELMGWISEAFAFSQSKR